jgi:pimeloyl-ACP methyl ester carboxylesterase
LSEPRRGAIRVTLPFGPLTIRWVEWGPVGGAPVICVHGLTRTGRDFDVLAEALAGQGRRVICPDMPGRGESGWLPDGTLYAVPTYVAACAQMLAALGRPFDWVGTSMGGLIGMGLAATPATAPRRMVLNDVGPFVPAGALQRIATYLALDFSFADMAAWEAHVRKAYAPFGRLTDEQWRHLAETSGRITAAGRVVPHYDPAIRAPFAASAVADIALWELWEALSVPMLVLRGEASDILPADAAARMAAKPGVRVETIAGVGHAPALMDAAQVAMVAGFLAEA